MMMVMTKTMVMMTVKADEDSDDDENEDNDDIIEQEEALSFDVAAPLITLAFSLWRLLEFSSRSQNGSICRAIWLMGIALLVWAILWRFMRGNFGQESSG